MLAGVEEFGDALEAFAAALKMLGSKLVPKHGLEPVGNIVRAHPEAQEITFFFSYASKSAAKHTK